MLRYLETQAFCFNADSLEWSNAVSPAPTLVSPGLWVPALRGCQLYLLPPGLMEQGWLPLTPSSDCRPSSWRPKEDLPGLQSRVRPCCCFSGDTQWWCAVSVPLTQVPECPVGNLFMGLSVDARLYAAALCSFPSLSWVLSFEESKQLSLEECFWNFDIGKWSSCSKENLT